MMARGYAYIDHGNRSLEAPTKEQLRKHLVRATKAKRAQVAVEFTQVTGYGRTARQRQPKIEYRHGTITGLHSANSNLLIRWDNGETEQMGYWGDQVSLTRLTPEQAEQWQTLYTTAQQAEIKLSAFLAEHAIDLPKATRAAIDAAVAGDESEE